MKYEFSCFRKKKALSQEEARVSPRWGTGVDILSTGGPWRGQQRRANTEVFGQTVKEEAVVQEASNGTVASTGMVASSGMVTVTPSGTPKARISMTSMDRGREDYISQFSERVGCQQQQQIFTQSSHSPISDPTNLGGLPNQSGTGEHLQQRAGGKVTCGGIGVTSCRRDTNCCCC